MNNSFLPLFFALCVGVWGTACSKDDGPAGNRAVNEAELQHLTEIRSDFAEKLTQDNAFAFDLLKTTVKFYGRSNRMLSPLSISMALNMTLNGASGTTRDEMLTALRVSGYTPEQINAYSQKLMQALINVDPNTKLSIANSIWYKTGFPVLAPFIETNRTNYDAAVEEVDFKAPATLGRINGWIADRTGGKIPTALTSFLPDAALYLINAIYFKSSWEVAFDKAATTDKPFLNSDGSTSSVPTMALRSSLKYGGNEDAACLELPYANKTFSMVILLPHEGKTIDGVIENLNPERWNTLLSDMREKNISLTLPRFTFEGDYALEQEILPEMGMRNAFTGQADFSLLSPVPTCISRVIHKTFIEVAEEGTEAAAATVVEMVVTTVDPNGPIPFHVDRPFLFAIKENATGTILFIGTVGKL
jgi:serpin B